MSSPKSAFFKKIHAAAGTPSGCDGRSALRQDHAEGRALSGLALDLDDALRKLHDLPDERQPEAVALGLMRGVALIEFLENALLHVRLHAAAAVGDGHDGALPLLQQRQRDHAPGRAELDRVGDQVAPDIGQHLLPAEQLDLVEPHAEGNPLRRPLWLELRDDLPKLLVEPEARVLLRKGLRLHLREHQNVADERVQAARIDQDLIQIVLALLSRQAVVLQKHRVALDHRERRFELMGHIGNKIAAER